MVGYRLLLAAGAIVLVSIGVSGETLGAGAATPRPFDSDSPGQNAPNEFDFVNAQNGAGTTVIEVGDGEQTRPEANEAAEAPQSSSDTSEAVGDVNEPPPPANCSPTNTTVCAGSPAAQPTPPDPGEPALTMSDIASFRPAPAEFGMEPDGWAVVGLPANFIAAAGGQTRAGVLLGRAVEVRFTPVRYAWAFSDGVTNITTTAGAGWSELGAREFTETATSRRFETSGRVTAQLIVGYSAEYRFAGSVWRSIAGTLDVPGETRDIIVGELDTVLTDGDCIDNPRGPGC